MLQPVVLTPPPPKRIKLERRTRSVGQRHAVILDVDMGVDAGQALMLAACRPDVDVMAVTCVSGIVTIEHACNNALRVLKACNREDVSASFSTCLICEDDSVFLSQSHVTCLSEILALQQHKGNEDCDLIL